MNLQNKQAPGTVGSALSTNPNNSNSIQRQLNLKVPLVQKQILNNNGMSGHSKISSISNTNNFQGINQGALSSLEEQIQNQNHFQIGSLQNQAPSGNNSALGIIATGPNNFSSGSYFRNAALSQFHKDHNHSPEPGPA